VMYVVVCLHLGKFVKTVFDLANDNLDQR